MTTEQDIITSNRLYALFSAFRDGDNTTMQRVIAAQRRDVPPPTICHLPPTAAVSDAAHSGAECLQELNEKLTQPRHE